MANDSASGGPLLPLPNPQPGPPPQPNLPLEGQALSRFIQQWIVGITGLPGNMVRPRWQSEPGNIPDAGEVWCAVGIIDRLADTFPQIIHNGAGEGSDQLQRNEQISIQASFYDTGSLGLADQYCAILRDGLAMPQNLEVLLNNNMQLAYTGDCTPAPIILKNRWLYRVDLAITVRRWIERNYPVFNLKSSHGTVHGLDVNQKIDVDFDVEPPTES